ncbi:unnamed protein product [Dimorphilus gyrociliatus]|uniref:Uncharacterized protein n=1 Tax=Dimorphilus gyrociliatus TaxID=2664684 RepID=A0A7I8W8U9_9ANNE|nr:unnamed protein product [Dimorphilus gyrociliatus]
MEFAKLLLLLSAVLLITLTKSENKMENGLAIGEGSGEVQMTTFEPDASEIHTKGEKDDDDHDEHDVKHEKVKRVDEVEDKEDEDEEVEPTTVSKVKKLTRPKKEFGSGGNAENHSTDSGSSQICWSITSVLLFVFVAIYGQ